MSYCLRALWASMQPRVKQLPRWVCWLQGIVSISCGSAHSGLLLRSGGVALAGCNAKGACGMSEDQGRVSLFCLADLPEGGAACQLSCGGGNTAVVTTGPVVLPDRYTAPNLAPAECS